jgi:hypothetical protein
LANAGALIGQLAGFGGGLDIKVFGDLSPELQQALAATSPVVYANFIGL